MERRHAIQRQQGQAYPAAGHQNPQHSTRAATSWSQAGSVWSQVVARQPVSSKVDF